MKYLIICLAFLGLFFSDCKSSDDQVTETGNPFLINPGSPALVIAHRGGRGLAPENTLAAFDNAVVMGVDVLEMDVCMTKDSVLVTIHDLTIDRTSDSSGNVSSFTYQELQQFNFGYNFKASDGTYPYRTNPVRIPRLEDVFGHHPNQHMEIEIKNTGEDGKRAAELLSTLIHSYNMTKNVIAFSFDTDVMDHFNSIQSDLFTGASLGESVTFVTSVLDNPDTILSMKADVFAFPTDLLIYNLTSDTIINAAHRHHIGIHYWTINDKEEMKSLIQKGADGIITDRPDLLKEALTELGFLL